MTGRSVPEWIGATHDTDPPPRVKLRVFEKYGGRCYLTGVKLGPSVPWQTDHIKAITNGGENRESNLAPIATAKHREKTADDVAEKSRVYRQRAKHLGIWPKGRGFDKNLRKRMNGKVEVRT